MRRRPRLLALLLAAVLASACHRGERPRDLSTRAVVIGIGPT
jgi:hypothetical protein